MDYCNSDKIGLKWNSYLTQAGLDSFFSNQLTTFLYEFEQEWSYHFKDVSYQLCQLESGNRLRPIISFLGYLISEDEVPLTPNDFGKIVKVGICIELIHKSSLIIDDIVDGDSFRRGKTTFHIANGLDKAIAVTSYLISKSFGLLIEVLSKSNMPENMSLKCVQLSINILNDLSTGLLKELSMDDSDFSNLKLTEEIIHYEAASIIKNSLVIGYILRGGNNSKVVDCLDEIGENCGYIFQVLNDIEPYKKSTEYINHKVKDELESFHKRKNIVTTFILQMMNAKDRIALNLIEDKSHAQKKLFEYFDKHDVYNHFTTEIEAIKENIIELGQTMNKQGVSRRWCENCKNFIESLTKMALDRVI